MSIIFLVTTGIIAAVIIWFVYTYNRFVTLRFRAKEALSDIDVQLKRRFDLIPNLIETVKGYIAHEKGVLESVTEARAKITSQSGNALQREAQESALSATLKTLFAVSENYPDLKANANFLDLQRELADTEDKIQASRRFYNGTVRDLNTKIETFPANIVAGAFNFTPLDFFRIEEESEKEPIKIKF